jgi:hypothetical protein
MSGVFRQSFDDTNNAQETELLGGTDQTKIGNTSDSLKTNVTNASGASAVNIQDGGNSITIDATSLPLPTGAATSTLQTTGNASLASIDAGIPAALGQTTMSASMPVVFASDQTALAVTGSLTTTPGISTVATYSASATNFVPAASATDVFTITGSATKTIKIIDFGFSSTTTAGSGIALGISFIKRSTANTGGTSVVATNVPYDSNNAAATAVVRHYTANPTLGTSVGTVRTRRIIVPAAGSNGSGTAGGSEEEFGSRPGQPIILRGVTQQFCINLNGTSITGPVSAAFVEWIEE